MKNDAQIDVLSKQQQNSILGGKKQCEVYYCVGPDIGGGTCTLIFDSCDGHIIYTSCGPGTSMGYESDCYVI